MIFKWAGPANLDYGARFRGPIDQPLDPRRATEASMVTVYTRWMDTWNQDSA